MGGPNWTDEQFEAITTGERTLLVSAAAGAGKTAVLVERIIKKITGSHRPADVDRLLVVTFTKAAAAEMRERISSEIIREINKNPESQHLIRQLTLLNRAAITTIHSFCLDTLRTYFYLVNLDPAFRVADDQEAALLRLDTIEELFEENYAAGNAGFLRLVDAFGGARDDEALQEMILKLYEYSLSNPWPEHWLNSLPDKYFDLHLPLEHVPWGITVLKSLRILFQGYRTRLREALLTASRPGGPNVYASTLREDLAFIDELDAAAARSWQELYCAFNSTGFPKLRACRDRNVDEQAKEQVRQIRDEVKKAINDIKNELFARSPDELSADLHRVAPMVKDLVGITSEFAKKYKKNKAVKTLVDFSDLEHYCLQILMGHDSRPGSPIPSDVAKHMTVYFTEVLVDEYQDINPVQETILSLITGEGHASNSCFMVGDVKQSIYRFRLADPDLFREKYIKFPREKGLAERCIDLTRNFRSRSEVVDAVNFIFSQVMTGTVGEIEYDEKAQLVSGASYPAHPTGTVNPGPVELFILEKKAPSFTPADGGEHLEDGPGSLGAAEREARLVAVRILELVGQSGDQAGQRLTVCDRKTGEYRPLQFRDIVVLLRTTKNTANVFAEEFRTAGIPAYADLGTGYFEATEIDTVISLLKIIDNPRQDIPLAAVLRSPVVGLNAEEMAAVRLRKPVGDFYDALLDSAALGETEADIKIKAFLDSVENWRTLARRGPLSELIWRIYNETGYYVYAGGMPGGAQRQANLRALHDRACNFEVTSFRGLFRFLRFIEKFRETGSDLGTARALGESEDVVRVLSIHKSKGLEFPVVFVAGLGKQFNTGDLTEKVLLHKELGLGMPVVETDLGLMYPTLAQIAVRKRLHAELLAEEMRILYVAMTRAREKLILVGSITDINKAASRWCETISTDGPALPDAILASAKNCLDWICPAVSRHQSGMIIRQFAGFNENPDLINDRSLWQVIIPDPQLLILEETGKGQDQTGYIENISRLEKVDSPPGYHQELNRRLAWKYSYEQVAGKPAKVTVTELKRFFETDEEMINIRETTEVQSENYFRHPMRPRFLQQEKGLSATERGIVAHLVMQHLQPGEDLTEEAVREQVNQMVRRDLLTAEQAAAVDTAAVTRFYTGPLGQRMQKAVNVRKEVPFTLAIRAGEVYELDRGHDEKIIVQGVIDCLIDEGDGFIIIDYKTDRYSPGSTEEAVRQYRGQLKLYAMAVEKILQKPVKERYLYFLSLDKGVKC